MRRINEFLRRYGALIIVAAVYLLFSLLGIGCPFLAATGVPCAGCGMTRAYLSLLHFDFKAAFYYHPLFLLVPAALILLLVKKGPLAKPKVQTVLWSMILAAFIITYLLRLLLIKNSAIYLFA